MTVIEDPVTHGHEEYRISNDMQQPQTSPPTRKNTALIELCKSISNITHVAHKQVDDLQIQGRIYSADIHILTFESIKHLWLLQCIHCTYYGIPSLCYVY